jgi:hypothetical protein
MRRHRHVADFLPTSFHDVDLGRPAAVVGEHPERRPDPGPDRYLRANFEVPVLLGKRPLGGEDARDVFIVEQHRLQLGRCPARDDRENSIADFEWVEPERRRCASGVARIDVDLLFAVPGILALEVGAVASPIARVRPGGASGIVRHPSPAR